MGRHRFQTRAYEHHKQNGRELGKGWMFSFKDYIYVRSQFERDGR